VIVISSRFQGPGQNGIHCIAVVNHVRRLRPIGILFILYVFSCPSAFFALHIIVLSLDFGKEAAAYVLADNPPCDPL